MGVIPCYCLLTPKGVRLSENLENSPVSIMCYLLKNYSQHMQDRSKNGKKFYLKRSSSTIRF